MPLQSNPNLDASSALPCIGKHATSVPLCRPDFAACLQERATENGFFAALEAKDKVLSKAKLVELKSANTPWAKKHTEGTVEAKKGLSMQMQFKQAKQQLTQERQEMRNMEEHDR